MDWDTDLDPKSVAYKIAGADENRVRVIAGPGTGKAEEIATLEDLFGGMMDEITQPDVPPIRQR